MMKNSVCQNPNRGSQQHQQHYGPAAVWQTVNRTDLNVKALSKGQIITMRTSSQRLAAVRKREAMLLASVNCSNLCLNLGSYLSMEKDTAWFYLCSYVLRIWQKQWCNFPTLHLKQTTVTQGLEYISNNYLRALIVVRPSTVSEKWQSKGSWVLSSNCCRSLTRRQNTMDKVTSTKE